MNPSPPPPPPTPLSAQLKHHANTHHHPSIPMLDTQLLRAPRLVVGGPPLLLTLPSCWMLICRAKPAGWHVVPRAHCITMQSGPCSSGRRRSAARSWSCSSTGPRRSTTSRPIAAGGIPDGGGLGCGLGCGLGGVL
ncbi:hypothetical protein NHJ13734_008525 [Beauveria thailandica]